jgi:F-type H+-transporting ATPase subunit epsilon
MATFSFELVSPERLLFTGQVEQVIVPGMEGDFAVMRDHMPFMSALRPGVLSITADDGEKRMFLRGGFADVSPSGLTVLAEQAIPIEEMGPGGLEAEIRQAEKEFESAGSEEARRLASERLAQMQELKAYLYG